VPLSESQHTGNSTPFAGGEMPSDSHLVRAGPSTGPDAVQKQQIFAPNENQSLSSNTYKRVVSTILHKNLVTSSAWHGPENDYAGEGQQQL
jgi:hypothetical protein